MPDSSGYNNLSVISLWIQIWLKLDNSNLKFVPYMCVYVSMGVVMCVCACMHPHGVRECMEIGELYLSGFESVQILRHSCRTVQQKQCT